MGRYTVRQADRVTETEWQYGRIAGQLKSPLLLVNDAHIFRIVAIIIVYVCGTLDTVAVSNIDNISLILLQ